MKEIAKILVGVAFLFFLSPPLPVTAGSESPGPLPEGPEAGQGGGGRDIPYLSIEGERQVDEAHAVACRAVTGAAQWLDSYFDDERFVDEENRSQVKLALVAEETRFAAFTFRPRLSIRLRLPKAEERLNLLFTVSDDDNFKAEDSPLTPAQAFQTGQDREEMSAALRHLLFDSPRRNLSTTTGISLSYLYAGLRYRGYYDYDSWQGRLVEQFLYYTDDGFENRVQYDIERKISDRWFFRTTAKIEWFEESDGLPHSLAFSLDQVLALDQVIRYEWINTFATSPSYTMSDLKVQARYRHRFYRDWLALEVVPSVSFPEEHNREFNPGIMVRLEADFGFFPAFAGAGKLFDF